MRDPNIEGRFTHYELLVLMLIAAGITWAFWTVENAELARSMV